MKKGLVYIFLTALLFATFEPVCKLISGSVHPLYMTFVRFMIGSAMLLPFAVIKIKKNGIKLKIGDYLYMTMLGVLVICLSMVLLTYAVRESASPAVIAIIFSSNSVMTIGLSALLLGEKITWRKIVAILLCLAGIIICSDLSSGTSLTAVLLAVASALSFSLYTVFSKKFMRVAGGIIQTGISFFAGSLVLLLFMTVAYFAFSVPVFSDIKTTEIPVLLYLGIGVTGIGYLCFFKALDKTSATATSLVFFIKPVLTPFVALLLVPDTKLTWQLFAALILVIAGSVLAGTNITFASLNLFSRREKVKR